MAAGGGGGAGGGGAAAEEKEEEKKEEKKEESEESDDDMGFGLFDWGTKTPPTGLYSWCLLLYGPQYFDMMKYFIEVMNE